MSWPYIFAIAFFTFGVICGLVYILDRWDREK